MIEGTYTKEIMTFKLCNSARSISVEVCVAQSDKRLTSNGSFYTLNLIEEQVSNFISQLKKLSIATYVIPFTVLSHTLSHNDPVN